MAGLAESEHMPTDCCKTYGMNRLYKSVLLYMDIFLYTTQYTMPIKICSIYQKDFVFIIKYNEVFKLCFLDM